MAISGGDGSIILNTKVDTKGLNSGLTSMKGAISKMGGLLAAAFSIRTITAFAKETKALYKTQMQNEVKLATVMRQRMKATDDEIKSVLELASAQQQIGIIGDEVQLAGLQQIATFATQKETIETLLPAMNNLIAQQYGYEASTESARNAANLMGKVLQGQTGALTRVGITFSEAEEQILKTGNEMERAAVLAQVITNNVGEMNTALAQTDVGRQQQLANTWDDIKEQFGAAFQQIAILALPALNAVAKALSWVANIARMVAQTIANIFGMKSDGNNQSAALNGISDSSAEAAEGMTELGDATEKAGKQAKKTTTNFDDLQILTESAASAAQSATEEMDNIASGIGESGTGFDFGIQSEVDTAPIENALKRIGALAKSIWDSTPIQEFVGKVKKLFESIYETAVAPTIAVIKTAWQEFSTALINIWNKYGQPIVEKIQEFAKKTIDLFQSIWDNVLAPIITPFLETLTWLWEEHIGVWIEKVGGFVASLIEGALDIYNRFIVPLVSWITEKLSPVWAGLSSLVIGVFGSILAVVGDTISSIFGILGGLIDFITGVFTGNWEKAWRGVKDVFKNIVDGLWAIIKYPLNLIIDGVNALIAGLNRVKLPDWDILGGLAGKGINIPKIPKLAQGTVLPGGKPFMAIVNDNPAGKPNIEAPAELIKQMAKEAIAEMGFGGQVQREEHYYLNEQELMSVVYRLFKGGERLNGESLVTGGAY